MRKAYRSSRAAVAALAVAVVLTVMSGTSAYAGGGSALADGAKEWTQLINKGQLIESVNKATSMVSNQLKMYQRMIIDATGLPVAEINGLRNTLRQAYNLYNSAESIAYGVWADAQSYATSWDSWFPDSANTTGITSVKVSEIADRDGKVCEDIAGITGNVAKQLGTDREALASEENVWETIDEMLKTPEGQQQAIQAAGYGISALGKQMLTVERNQNTMKHLMAIQVQAENQARKEQLDAHDFDMGVKPKSYNRPTKLKAF